MSWSIKRPDVSLRVARFAPDKPVAGLTDEQRAAHRERRAAECAKVEPEIYEVRKACNVFLYGNFVELERIGPLGMGPLEPAPHACDDIDCIECQNRGLRYGDWLKAKRLNEL